MKTQVYKIIKTSYRYDDENGTTEFLFNSESLMNQYFYILYNEYKNNKSYHGLTPSLTEEDSLTCNQFEFNDGGKWSYEVNKEISELIIHESLNDLI